MQTNYANRMMSHATDAPVITGAVAAEIASIKHATLRSLQKRDEVAPAPLGVTDVLGLTVASRIAELGVPLTRAVDIANVVTVENWKAVMLRESETSLHLVTTEKPEGGVIASVVDDTALAALGVRPRLYVNLTAVARVVWSRILAETQRMKARP